MENEIDIVGVTETWLSSLVLDSELNIKDFTLFRQDREKIRQNKGGGVLLYIRENLNALPDDELNSNDCESLWLKIYRNKKDFIIVGVCYKSPTAGMEEISKCQNRSVKLVTINRSLWVTLTTQELTGNLERL